MGWTIDEDAVESIAIGAGILGAGGGGNPYLSKLRLLTLLKQGAQVEVKGIDELSDDAVVVGVGGIGAPTVGVEKLPQGQEGVWALKALENYAGLRADALICLEVGGGNSISPMIVGAYTGLPVVDADGMGRAFPEVQMTSFFIYGVPCVPAALCDAKGQTVIFDQISDSHTLELMARAVTIQMGCTANLASPIMSGRSLKRTAIGGTLSQARTIGEIVRRARLTHDDPISALLQLTGGQVIFGGKIISVDRRTTQGFARGQVLIAGVDRDRGQQMRIDFQNENLIAWQNNLPVVTVPDLISIVDAQTAEPITTEQLRYGYRVAVLAIKCDSKMSTPQALRVVGPRCFGYDVEYISSSLQ